jgi:hypothetical protein
MTLKWPALLALILVAGFITGACVLSPNIDLPSGRNEQESGGDGDVSIGDGDISLGDGDASPGGSPGCGGAGGMGGSAAHSCP